MLDSPHCSPDTLVDLERLLDEMPAAQQRAKFGDQLDRVGIWLQQQTEAISAFAAMVEACGDLRERASPNDAAAIRDHLDEVIDFGELMAKAADGKGLSLVLEACADAKSHMNQCQYALKRVANDMVAKEFQPLRSSGELISELDRKSTLGERLVTFATGTANLDKAPAKDFATRVHSALAEAAGYRTEIEQLAHEPEQKDFLNALVKGTATLAKITPAILEWLDEHGALDRFAVLPHSRVR